LAARSHDNMTATEPQPAPARPRRRWLQYSLRTLLVFMVLASVPMSWLAVKMHHAREQREAVEAMRAYLDPAAEFVWRPRKALLEVFGRLRDERPAGVHQLHQYADTLLLSRCLRHGQHPPVR